MSQLGRAFSLDLRRIDPTIPNGQQSFPLVIGGVIYVTTGNDHVFAVDGSSGKVLWHYKPTDTGEFKNYGINANRGVAYCDDKLFLLTLDMRIVSLDPKTGKLIKQVEISDAVPDAKVEFGYSETQAPICYKDTLLLGASGSDYGVRGFVMAYKPDLTPAWANPFWTIPPEGQGWRRGGRYVGGGTNWNPVSVDTATDTVYVTTSNPSPIFDASLRPGSNPRTDALLALDLWTGQLKWWQQQIAGDQWGYSTSQPALVYDVSIGGTKRRVVSVATKEGTWFMYDAKTGAPIYQRVRLLNHIEHPTLKAGRAVVSIRRRSAVSTTRRRRSTRAPGYVINNQAETSAVLIQKKDTAAANRYKARGDVDNGLANGSFGGSAARLARLRQRQRGRRASRHRRVEVRHPGAGTRRHHDDGVRARLRRRRRRRAARVRQRDGERPLELPDRLPARRRAVDLRDQGQGVPRDHDRRHADLLVRRHRVPARRVHAQRGHAAVGRRRRCARPARRRASPRRPTASCRSRRRRARSQLQVVASLDDRRGAPTLNGTRNGTMIVRVPKGWRLNITFANHSAVNPDGLQVTSFANATSGPVPASGVAYFPFTASKEGSFELASTVPTRAAAGEWMRLEIVPSNSLPELVYDGVTYAINPAGRRG